MRTFVRRTVKEGRVKIAGQWFAPSTQWKKYDGRFDGGVYWFGRYENCPFVYLWGSDRQHQKQSREGFLDCAVDGRFVWAWWHTAKHEAKLVKEREARVDARNA